MGEETLSLERLLDEERERLKRALYAENTEIGYGYDWRLFTRWCGYAGKVPLPSTVETVSLFLTAQLSAGKKVATVIRRASAIGHIHRSAGFESPITGEIRSLLMGARRLRCERPRQMRPLALSELHAISTELGKRKTPRAVRNRAILVLGFASALRRESLGSLDLEDIGFCAEGLVIRVRKEKQDQEGKGRFIGIPAGRRRATCSVRCLRDWIGFRGDSPGPLFTRIPTDGCHLQGEAIYRMIKASVGMIGLDPAQYGGHSLRSGFTTAAGESGLSDLLIADHTGHRSMQVLRSYFRRSDLFRSNACAAIGL